MSGGHRSEAIGPACPDVFGDGGSQFNSEAVEFFAPAPVHWVLANLANYDLLADAVTGGGLLRGVRVLCSKVE